MANSSLQGKCIKIDGEVKNHLLKIYNAYKGDKTNEGYGRLKNLCDSVINMFFCLCLMVSVKGVLMPFYTMLENVLYINLIYRQI